MMEEEIGVMVDLETLAQEDPHAAIVSIGAQGFRRHAQVMLDSFEVNIDLQSSLDSGGVVDGDTIRWWMLQRSDEEREHAFGGSCTSLREALEAFQRFLDAQPGSVTVWGNGAAFDNVKLSNAYRRLGMPIPWHFRNDRCYRTIKAEAAEVKYPREQIAHCALADARAQVEHLFAIDRYRSSGASLDERQTARAVLAFIEERFPWITDSDESVSGADVVDELVRQRTALAKIAT
jgi:hypothetical protein